MGNQFKELKEERIAKLKDLILGFGLGTGLIIKKPGEYLDLIKQDVLTKDPRLSA